MLSSELISCSFIVSSNLSDLKMAHGDAATACALAKQALEARRRTLGAEHLDTRRSVATLGRLMAQRGLFAEAQPLWLRLPPAFSLTLSLSLSLSLSLLRVRVRARVTPSLNRPLPIAYLCCGYYIYICGSEEALTVARRELGDADPETLQAMSTLASLYAQIPAQQKMALPLFTGIDKLTLWLTEHTRFCVCQ